MQKSGGAQKSQISSPASRNDLVDTAKGVSLIIDKEADRMEEIADLTENVRDALTKSELFWIMVPTDLGGSGADIATTIEVTEEISRADGSTGWAYFCNAVSTAGAAAYGTEELVNAMFKIGPRAVCCGQYAPIGQATKTAGGFIVKGHHQFASGSFNASWMGSGQRILDETGAVLKDKNGQVEGLISYFPKEKVRMAGNWNVTGLKGTGSCDYVIPEQFVTEGFTMPAAALFPDGGKLKKRGGSSFTVGYFALGHAMHDAVVVGMARRALQEVSRIVAGKSRLGYEGPVANFAVFKDEFALHEASFWSIRRHLIEFYESLDAHCADGTPLTEEHMARIPQVTVYTHKMTHEIIRFCASWTGSSIARRPSVIARILHDMAVANNHMITDRVLLQRAAPPILDAWTTGRLSLSA
jgi:alkylation response protein AidB-like acyl-CoA dehydrogenase